MAKKPVIRQAPCNKCLRSTRQEVVWEERRPGSEADEHGRIYIEWNDSYAVMKCMGCEDIRLRHSHWFSEETGDDGEPIVHVEYYPATVTRQKPIWRREIFPYNDAVVSQLSPLFDEVYAAHSSGLFRIAVMGIRALSEKIMVDQVEDRGTFASTMEAFFSAGYVAPRQQELFKGVLIEAGHAAMHRNFEPASRDVDTLLDVLEGIVETIYYQPARADAIKKKIPADTRRARKRQAAVADEHSTVPPASGTEK